jgi:hypothetical protein
MPTDQCNGGADPLVRAGRPRPAFETTAGTRPTGAPAADRGVRPTEARTHKAEPYASL